jgi:hypothetical protein
VVTERVLGLTHQGDAVGEEQHPLHPVLAHEQLGQRDHRPRLARAGRHHQQRLALVLHLERLGHRSDGALLVVALHDRPIDGGILQRPSGGAPLDEQLELVLGVEALDLARGIERVVPEVMGVAVGVEDDGPLPGHLLQAVRVQLGLALADLGILAGALGLDQPQRQAVVAPEHVVHEALLVLVGHAGDRVLAIASFAEGPAGLVQQEIDEVVAGLLFGVVVIVGTLLGEPLGLGDLRAEPHQLGVHRGVVGSEVGEPLVLLAQLGLQRTELIEGLLGHRPGRGERRGIERQPGRGPGAARIGARQPVGDVEQLAHRHDRVRRLDGAVAVHRLVAELGDQARLLEHRLARHPLEGGFVDERAEVVLVGDLQRRVVLVGPRHEQLERAPRVEARGPRIGIGRLGGAGGRIVHRGPFGREERERRRHWCPTPSPGTLRKRTATIERYRISAHSRHVQSL